MASALSTIRFVLCFFGFSLSAYALYVEHKKSANPFYEAGCDLSEWISCSKVFTGEYGHIFYLPNAAYGTMFYPIMLLLNARGYKKMVLYLSVLACLGSLYLGYILAFVLRDLCIVCTSIYVINFFLLILNYFDSKKSSKSKSA
eukprot:TRINITY_DN1452_c0_g1::TRINITY_DN1452_c0_g1_i1::g.27195::m.27195 TRINITY_DN1452_c0_g1::TRINITY_DN1452_c0_g1_i1::g.27195  ORF type:complete len:144 (+),score=26.66,sp/Q6TEK3/VKORL_RAT/39.57/8e-26,VKOR/PF07884.9/5.4e-27,SPC25/PF06703.6/12,SPC25/PF06703.6/29 TRINITY_DN1452_c0_g1_i1:55-486(+)